MLFLFGFIHCSACLWFGLGNSNGAGDVEIGWVHYYGVIYDGVFYQYATSLHWSMTQITGSMDIQPRNSYERGFAFAVLFLSSFVCCSVVSSMTSSMTRLHIVTASETNQMGQ